MNMHKDLRESNVKHANNTFLQIEPRKIHGWRGVTPAAPHGGGRRRTFAASMFCLAQTCGPLTMLRWFCKRDVDVETRLTGWPRKTLELGNPHANHVFEIP